MPTSNHPIFERLKFWVISSDTLVPLHQQSNVSLLSNVCHNDKLFFAYFPPSAMHFGRASHQSAHKHHENIRKSSKKKPYPMWVCMGISACQSRANPKSHSLMRGGSSSVRSVLSSFRSLGGKNKHAVSGWGWAPPKEGIPYVSVHVCIGRPPLGKAEVTQLDDWRVLRP